MAIKVQCPNAVCGQIITVRDEYAGKRGKCPSCGAAMMIPPAAAREAPTSRPTPTPQDRPRSGILVDVTDNIGLPPQPPADELRLPPSDADDVPPDAVEPSPVSTSSPLAGYTMAELATRTALLVGIVALVLLSFIPQVRWLYVSSKDQDRGRVELLQRMFAGSLMGDGPGTALLTYSALLALLSIVCLLVLGKVPPEVSDSAITAVGAMAGGWGVTVLFWLLGYIWKAFAVASEVGSKSLTILPGFGLILGFFAALAIIAVFGYLVASRRRFFWLLGAGALGFFFGVFLLIFNARPWDVKLFTGPGAVW